MSEAPVHPLEEDDPGTLYSVVMRPYFSLGYIYVAACDIPKCGYTTGKRGRHTDALSAMLDHLKDRHGLVFT